MNWFRYVLCHTPPPPPPPCFVFLTVLVYPSFFGWIFVSLSPPLFLWYSVQIKHRSNWLTVRPAKGYGAEVAISLNEQVYNVTMLLDPGLLMKIQFSSTTHSTFTSVGWFGLNLYVCLLFNKEINVIIFKRGEEMLLSHSCPHFDDIQVELLQCILC